MDCLLKEARLQTLEIPCSAGGGGVKDGVFNVGDVQRVGAASNEMEKSTTLVTTHQQETAHTTSATKQAASAIAKHSTAPTTPFHHHHHLKVTTPSDPPSNSSNTHAMPHLISSTHPITTKQLSNILSNHLSHQSNHINNSNNTINPPNKSFLSNNKNSLDNNKNSPNKNINDYMGLGRLSSIVEEKMMESVGIKLKHGDSVAHAAWPSNKHFLSGANMLQEFPADSKQAANQDCFEKLPPNKGDVIGHKASNQLKGVKNSADQLMTSLVSIPTSLPSSSLFSWLINFCLSYSFHNKFVSLRDFFHH